MAELRAPTVGIVIPSFNHERHTLRCLAAVEALDYPSYQVVVVDNGSAQRSFLTLRERVRSAEFVRLHVNRGFSGAVNVGIRWALERGAAYVWLLNNDAFVSRDSLSALVARAQSDPGIGAVGSLLDEGGALVCGARLNLWTGCATHLRHPAPEREISYLIGASMLIRAQVLQDVGLFDEGYFLYWEDAEFSFRLRRAGWRLAVAREGSVEHRGQAPLALGEPKRDFHYTRSSLRFLRRHSHLPAVATTLLTTRRLASRLRHRRWQNAWAILRALRQREPSSQRPVPAPGPTGSAAAWHTSRLEP